MSESQRNSFLFFISYFLTELIALNDKIYGDEIKMDDRNKKHKDNIDSIVSTFMVIINLIIFSISYLLTSSFFMAFFIQVVVVIITWITSQYCHIAAKEIYLHFWKKSHKRIYVHGIWHFIQIFDNDENYFRVGRAEIEQNFYTITITAQHSNIQYVSGHNEKNDDDFYDVSKLKWTHNVAWSEQTSTWDEKNAEIDVGTKRINGNYHATREFEQEQRIGLHQMHINGNENEYPNQITGIIFDFSFSGTANIISSECNRMGHIYFFKNKSDLDFNVKKLCKPLAIKNGGVFTSCVEIRADR
jgi:hypothetical protein